MIQNQASFHSMKEENIRHSYDGFQSERHETTQDMQHLHVEKSDRNIHTGLEFHIKYPIQSLLQHFKLIFNSKGFKVIEVFPGKIMLTKLTFKDRLKKIFRSIGPAQYLLSVHTQEYRSVRKILIKPLNAPLSEHPEIKTFYEWMQEEPLVLNIKEPAQRNQFEESEYQQDIFSLDATSTYMYHKIFVDRNYSIGKKMEKFIQQNEGQLQTNNSSIRKERQVVGGLQEITDDMLQSFNCTRKELLEILCYCRKSVEDYYHNRTYAYQTHEQMEIKNSSIQTQLTEKLPQTIKAFLRLCAEKTSITILRSFFFLKYIFNLECQILQINAVQKKALGTKLGQVFHKDLEQKVKVLEMWKYPIQLYEQYLVPFSG